MEASASRVGLSVRFYGIETFTSWRQRLTDALDLLPSLGTTHVLMLDAYDTLFLRGEAEIFEAYSDYSDPPLLLSTEKDCWPRPELSSSYPPSQTPWKYINGGGWMGEIPYLLEHIPKVLASGEDTNDQALWTWALIDKSLPCSKLDVWCRVFQTMSRSDRDVIRVPKEKQLFNKVTGSRPCIAHWNGRTGGREDVWQMLSR